MTLEKFKIILVGNMKLRTGIDPDKYQSYLNVEMHKYKEDAHRKLSQFVHPDIILPIALMLVDSWYNDQPSAKTLADTFDLTPIDFMAIIEDIEAFELLYMKEHEFDGCEERYAGY